MWRAHAPRPLPWGQPSGAGDCIVPVVDGGGRSVGPVGVLRAFQLHLQSLHADLEAVHRLDGGVRTRRVVETHKPCDTDRNTGAGLDTWPHKTPSLR